MNDYYTVLYDILCKVKNNNTIDDYHLQLKLVEIVTTYGNLNCLKYLIQYNYKIDDDILVNFTLIDCLDCFKYAHQYGFKIPNNVILIAIKNEFIDIIDYIILSGENVSYEYVLKMSSEYGKLNCLMYAHEKSNGNYTNNSDYCQNAASYGHLECLQYLHTNGYIITPDIFYLCILNIKKMDCLFYLHKHLKLLITEDMCLRAIRYNRFDFFQYAHQNECPWDNKNRDIYADEANSYQHYDIVDYIENNGGKCNKIVKFGYARYMPYR